jgi:hypothetical protein
MAVKMFVDFDKHELPPQAGGSYIFFVTRDNARPTSSLTTPYSAIKLLAATDENIAELKRLIALPVNQHQLSGSMVRLPEAAKSDVTFIGVITKLGSPDMDGPGETGYDGTEAKVIKVFRGSIDNPVVLDLRVSYNPHEEPPKIGPSYIFFTNEIPGYNEVKKILPVTDENVDKVLQALQADKTSQNHDFFSGDDLKPETALVKSDAIFVGEITTVGMQDQGYSFSYAYPGIHLCGVGVNVTQVLRGAVGNKTSVTLFVKAPLPSDPSELKGPYIFFVKSNGGSGDAFTVLKVLRSSEATIAQTKQLIVPSPDYVYGSSISLNDAVAKSETIYVGDITELGGGQESHVTVFETLRGAPPRHTAVNVKMDSPPKEGCSYIFIGTKNTQYEGDTVDVLQLISATEANIQTVKGIIAHTSK